MGVFIIAEAGVNHNGDRDMALALVDAAAEAGADAVKIPTFRAADAASASSRKAPLPDQTTDDLTSHPEPCRHTGRPRGGAQALVAGSPGRCTRFPRADLSCRFHRLKTAERTGSSSAAGGWQCHKSRR